MVASQAMLENCITITIYKVSFSVGRKLEVQVHKIVAFNTIIYFNIQNRSGINLLYTISLLSCSGIVRLDNSA